MIVAFTGKKQSGKSTACAYIERGHLATRVNFKDGLVKELKEKFPNLLTQIIKTMDIVAYDGMNEWTIERLFSDKPPLMRALMQNYGTEVRRGDDPDYWVKQWISTVSRINHLVLCDDVRFINEAKAVHDVGGVIIRIERTDMLSTDTHISEVEMESIDADHTISVGSGEHRRLYNELDFILDQCSNIKTSKKNTKNLVERIIDLFAAIKSF